MFGYILITHFNEPTPFGFSFCLGISHDRAERWMQVWDFASLSHDIWRVTGIVSGHFHIAVRAICRGICMLHRTIDFVDSIAILAKILVIWHSHTGQLGFL